MGIKSLAWTPDTSVQRLWMIGGQEAGQEAAQQPQALSSTSSSFWSTVSSSSSAEQYLEHCEQSTGRSQNSPQAVPDYLLRKTDSSLPPAISRNLEQIYGLSEKL